MMCKILNFLILTLFIIAVPILLINCDDNPEIIKTDNTEKYTVPLSVARNLATSINLSNPYKSRSSAARKASFNEIEWEQVVEETDNKNSYYVFNFKNESGYVLLAGDYRSTPIFAYSDNGSFPNPGSEINPGLFIYLEQYLDHVAEIRDSLNSIPTEIRLMWSSIGLDSQLAPIDDEPCNCNSDPTFMTTTCQEICGVGSGAVGTVYNTTIGPLINTEWGQSGYYNDNCPNMGCSNTDPQALTGCVATAMAQVMRFWEHPTIYNWANMPLGKVTTTNSDVAKLMFDCGIEVFMDYGCDASSTDTKVGLNAFPLSFGYSNDIQYKDYDLYQVEQEIEIGRPVILRGVEIG